MSGITDQNLSQGESAAREAITELAEKHGLGFMHNPGGGQFTCIDDRYPLFGFKCQIHFYNYEEDLEKLQAAIAAFLQKSSPKK